MQDEGRKHKEANQTERVFRKTKIGEEGMPKETKEKKSE